MRSLKEIVLHCSATPEGRHVTVETIRKWHKKRKWKDIGYHFVIYLDGSIHDGRPLDQIGAHVRGRNTGTIGICYVGGVAADGKTAKDTRTPQQKAALVRLMTELVRKYPTIKLISGHHDYANKACPCFPARKEYAGLIGGSALASTAPKVDERYRYLQRLLARTGRDFGLVDGIPGSRTVAAIKDYQEFMGLPVTGEFDAVTVKALRAQEDHVPDAVTKVVTDADKPLTQSKTVWGAIVAAVSSVMSTLADLDKTVALALIGVVVIAAGFIIWDRRRKQQLARTAKSQT